MHILLTYTSIELIVEVRWVSFNSVTFWIEGSVSVLPVSRKPPLKQNDNIDKSAFSRANVGYYTVFLALLDPKLIIVNV